MITPDIYLCPGMAEPAADRLRWLQEQTDAAEKFLLGQSAASDIDRAKQIIAGLNTVDDKLPKTLSKIKVNIQKRLVRETVASVSNLRPFGGFKTDNHELDEPADILNKLLRSWYFSTFADRKIRSGLQYAGATGTGYVGPTYKSDFWNRGRGDIDLKIYGPMDVLPIQLPTDNDLQRAYAVTLREEVPINLARAMFPNSAASIVPDRTTPKGMASGGGRPLSFLSPVLNLFSTPDRTRSRSQSVFPTVDIFHTYIVDLSVNESGHPIVMGEPGTYWCHTVPSLGSDIPIGKNLAGEDTFRKANAEDAMMYPMRRLITWTNTAILRDGPSFWWHGKVPVVKFSFDDWAWELLGYSLTRDLDPIEVANNTMRRAVVDAANSRLRPPLQYDDKTIAKAAMEQIDTRQPGLSVGVDMTVGDSPIKPLLTPEYYNVPPFVFDVINGNEEMMKYLAATNDFTALAKARQLPASDTIEKMLEMAGPVMTDVTRGVESSVAQLVDMIKGLFFEFYTGQRRLQILGNDGITQDDFDFVPNQMIPDHLPNEDKEKPTMSSMIDRAKFYMNSFVFHVTPNSMHAITQMSRKLSYLQLARNGFPLDPWTLAEVFDIPDFGPPPQSTKNVMERWQAFKRMEGELQAVVQAKAQEILAASQMKTMMMAAASGIMPGGGPPGGGPPGEGPVDSGPSLGDKQPGRPPSGNKPPHLETKDGGTRTTISES